MANEDESTPVAAVQADEAAATTTDANDDGVVHFVTPTLYDNPNGWGPSEDPDLFKDVPYAPFSKSDRLGRAADWTSQGQYQRGRGQYQSQGVNSAFNYYHVDDDADFQAVEKKARNFNKFRRPFQNRHQYQRNGPARGRRGQQWDQVKPGKQQQQPQHNKRRLRWATRRWGRWRRNDVQRELESSLDIQSDWKAIDEIELAMLSKLSTSSIPVGEDIVTCGKVEYYDPGYDRVTTKHEKILEHIERVHHYVTTSEDPKLQDLAENDEGNIFATDALISMLMAATRSVYSWDIVVHRVGNKLFFDKRPNSNFDYLTVNETCPDISNDDDEKTKDPNNINSISTLSREATFINQNFSQQVLDRSEGAEKFSFDEPNPFREDDNVDIASVGYIYRKFDLGDGQTLVGRCEITGVKKPKDGEVQDRPNYMLVKALNEYDPKITDVDWRQKLDSQRGAVLATELRNNSCKLTRWTVQAVLAGAESMYLGYVSRVHFKDNFQHVVLGTQMYTPEEFARQINLKMKNMWAIFKHLATYFMEKPEGKYLLFREPNKTFLKVYEVPAHAFDDEDDDEDDESEL